MVAQFSEIDRFDIRSIPTPRIYTHLVTLIHRASGKEVSFEVETLSDRFSDVMREICHQRAIRELFGYEIFEFIETSGLVPF